MKYIAHHGIKGQRWGVRRYQNEDGSLTPAGERRYKRLTADIERVENLRGANRELSKRQIEDSRIYFHGQGKKNSEKRFAKAKARSEASLDYTEIVNKARIAYDKGKLDPKYKDTKEYKETMSAWKKQNRRDYLLGSRWATEEKYALEKLGYDEKTATRKAAAKTWLARAALFAAVSAMTYAASNY